MRIRVKVDKVAALKAGKDRHGLFVVDIPAAELSGREREVLAESEQYGGVGQPEADFYLDKLQCFSDGQKGYLPTWQPPDLSEPTPEEVRRLLAARMAFHDAEEEMSRERKRKEAERREAETLELLQAPVEKLVEGLESYSTPCPVYALRREGMDPRLAGRLKEAEAYAEKLREERGRELERQEQKERAKEAGEAAAVEELKDWAVANGSPLLRARVEDGYKWLQLAEQEYARSVVDSLGVGLPEEPGCPQGYCNPGREERTTPTLEEIEAARRVDKAVEGKGLGDEVSVELVWFDYDPEIDEDEYYEEEPEHLKRAELEVTVTCPTGREIEFFFVPVSAETTS